MRLLVLCGLLACAAASTGCAARASIPLGQIPVAERPDPAVLNSTLSYVNGQAASNNQKIVKNAAQKSRVQKIVDRLARAASAKGFSYPVVLVDAGDEVNAAAVNGSVIMVYTELLKRVPNDSELATVLGHEVGHILAKHHTDEGSQGRAQEVSVGSAILGTVVSVGASVAGAGAGAADLAGDVTSDVTEIVGTGAYVLAYDRDMEREADNVGLMLMAKAGYDPRSAVTFWSKAGEIFGGDDSLAFFSTHPASDDRVARLQEAMPLALSYYSKK